MTMTVVAALIASFSFYNVAALGTNRDSIAVGCQAHGFFRKSPRSRCRCFLTKSAAVDPHGLLSLDAFQAPDRKNSRNLELEVVRGEEEAWLWFRDLRLFVAEASMRQNGGTLAAANATLEACRCEGSP